MQQYTHEYIKSIPHLPVYCLLYETYRQMSPSHWHDHLEIIYVLEENYRYQVMKTLIYMLMMDIFFIKMSSIS